MAFASVSVCPVATETRIAKIDDIYVKQGDKAPIAACGQLNGGSGWVDMESEYLNFTVSNSKNQEIFNKNKKMSFWDGKASIDIDTAVLTPGNYTVNVKFMGNKYLRPCKMHASLIVISS